MSAWGDHAPRPGSTDSRAEDTEPPNSRFEDIRELRREKIETTSNLLRWSGRRDSNPRPSPWQGAGSSSEVVPAPQSCRSVHPVSNVSTQSVAVVERSTMRSSRPSGAPTLEGRARRRQVTWSCRLCPTSAARAQCVEPEGEPITSGKPLRWAARLTDAPGRTALPTHTFCQHRWAHHAGVDLRGSGGTTATSGGRTQHPHHPHRRCGTGPAGYLWR